MAPQRFVGTGADDLTQVEEPRRTPDNGTPPAPLTTPGSYREDTDETPIHAASLRSQWATPTLKTATVWCGTSALTFAIMAYVSPIVGLSIPRPGLLSFIVGSYPSVKQWAKDEEHFNYALYRVRKTSEKILQKDLDGDGVIGEPGTVVMRERKKGKPESNASKKRRAIIALAELVWKKQNADPPLKTGVKALYGTHLPGGYKVDYDLHKEVGELLIKSGYAQTKRVGANKTWELLPDVRLEELSKAAGVWDDD